MGYDGGGGGFQMAGGGGRADLQGGSSSFSPQRDEAWPMNLGANRGFEGGSYPERPGLPNCAYYIRTGLCRFGKTCKFNHPHNRKLAIANAKNKGGYPERLGEPECQYYLKTGTCKFGATCKFHHPRDKAGITGRVQLNILGFPLRPNETECSYYLRTGQCKFGNTCKFHHPQPSNTVLSFRGSPVYPSVHSPTTHAQQSVGGSANWPRTSFIASPRWQGPSSYAQVILHQGMMPVTGWNPYSGSPGSISSPQNHQQATENALSYGNLQKSETNGIGSQGTFSLHSGADPYSLHKKNMFPERPGEPECVFYMKTGDCKFGASCRFHHPRERMFSVPDCVLSPLGLPLRPEEPLCIFYSRYGICKFGPNCKFNHPMGPLTYGLPSTSSVDVPVAQHVLGSASSTALPVPSQMPDEENSENSLQLPGSEPQNIASGDENSETEDKDIS